MGNSENLQAKVLEFWSPAPLLEGDPGKSAMPLAELKEPKGCELECSSDSSVRSESEVEITGASGPPTTAASKRKTRRAMKKIPLSKMGLTAAQRSQRSSTPKGASKVQGPSAPPVTAEVGSAATRPTTHGGDAPVL